MWNLYVAALLVLYAPAAPKAGISVVLNRAGHSENSQAPLTGNMYNDGEDSSDDEQEQFNQANSLPMQQIPTEISVLSSFITKPTEKLT